ncbi:MAG TPA: DUF6220 domain-containing protein [Candidatus Limnocylindrales bacterium]|nr:DUF6220 domain-containing protein [Candidatus Limnocylindrales bacterium]
MTLLRVHALAAIVFVVAVVVQIFLAGAALAQLGGSGNFATHIEFGYTWIGIAALVLLITALVARRPRREIGIAALIFVLYVVQTILPNFRSSASFIAALHPLNAAILLALAVWYARRTWQASMAS